MGELNLNMAPRLIEAAKQQASTMGRSISIAVVDGSGNLVAVERMDGAPLVSLQLAVDKAYTAALLQMSTQALGEMARPGGPLFGIHATHSGHIVIFGEGEPLTEGAIGVSGAAVAEDIQIARAGVQAALRMGESRY